MGLSRTALARNYLVAVKLAQTETLRAPNAKTTRLSFVCDTACSRSQTDLVVKEKTELLAKHYDMSNIIGRHGEDIVLIVCKELGYVEIESRKEKHGLAELGIGRRDIDVWGKPPGTSFYQNIEVRNRRAPVTKYELQHIVGTSTLAQNRWNLSVKPALVAPFLSKDSHKLSKEMQVPVAFSEGQYVPEKFRSFYEELNDKLAWHAIITDSPTPKLSKNIESYISHFDYGG